MERGGLKVHLGPLKLDKLGHAETMPVREQEQRGVPVPVAPDRFGRGDELLHLGGG